MLHSEEAIDECVATRDIARLTYFIQCGQALPIEVRFHLGQVIGKLLRGDMRFPKRRPKKALWIEQRNIGEEVWSTKRRLNLSKVSSAVTEVVKRHKCSERKVWTCWTREGDVVLFELDREKHEHDAMVELAYEARWDAAKEALAEEFGADREFSDEEVEERAAELEEEWSRDWASFHPD